MLGTLSKRILKLFVSCIVRVFDWSVSSCRRVLRFPPAPTCVILYYHVIERSVQGKFAWQVDCIRKNAVTMDLDGIGNTQLECGHRVIVTFDDASISVLENALTELAARNIPATVFVPVSHIG